MVPLTQALIGTHAFLGEAGALAFLWVLVEMIGGSAQAIRRARIAAIIGTVFFFLAWTVGGFYYVEFYGELVKPIIKAGPQPWAHSVITETKEHVFLFLPFLALLTTGILERFKNEFAVNTSARRTVIIMAASITLIAFAMAGMGFLISSGYRAATDALAL